MKGGFKHVKAIGSLVGVLFGVVLGFLPGIDDVFWHRSHYADLLIRRFGMIGGSSQMILMFLPYAIIGGVILGILSFLGGWRVEAIAKWKSQRSILVSQESGEVWPPPQTAVKEPHDSS